MEYLSTSALANELEIKSSDLFDKLKAKGWIDRKNEKWVLTELGKQNGGQIRNNPKFGDYIVWPHNISFEDNEQKMKTKLINATAIGKHFEISSQRLNLILSELGWIEKDIAGWQVTKLGKNLGGKQFEHETSGGTYVLWPDSILNNKNLVSVFKDSSTAPEIQKTIPDKEQEIDKKNTDNFREKFPASFRTKDGHMVRSRAEVIIDNALYDYKLAHAYERKLPVEEEVYSDFFIPTENVYIEFWGMEGDPKYSERKKAKIDIYKKYDFKLIELNDNDILNLDDHLPKKLLKFNIKVY
ncbi:MAG: glycerol kinase [Bacteroidetes bacterium]|nr:glycerol kinase [Bacteroidota bacterium]